MRSSSSGGPRSTPSWKLIVAGVLGLAAPLSQVAGTSPTGVLAAASLVLLGVALLVLLDGSSRAATHHRGWTIAVACAAAVVAGALHPFTVLVVVVGIVLSHAALAQWRPRSPAEGDGPSVPPLALAPLVLAMFRWYRAPHADEFIPLALLAAVLLVLPRRFPAPVARFERGVARAAHALGQFIVTATATVVMVLVVAPISALSRLVRYSPIDGGWASDSTAWVRVDPARLRTVDGQVARSESMALLELPPSPRTRRRRRLRLLVPVLALAAVGLTMVDLTVVDLPGQDEEERPTGSVASDGEDTFTQEFEDDPAFEGAPWAQALRLGLLESWENLEFNAAVGGWQFRDVSSEYVNVRDGARATTTPDPALGDPLRIWWFGGSAAFGAGQRDEHTIPSELVELAGAIGVPLEIHNLAVPATVNWQSAMLLVHRLKSEPPPDLIVFYEGANDLALQDVLAAEGRGQSDAPASLLDGQLDQVLRERAAEEGAGAAADPAATPHDDPPPDPRASGALVATRYRRGLEVIRDAAADADVPVVVYWQPELQTKTPASAADLEVLASVNIDERLRAQRREQSAAARGELEGLGVVDLTTSLDGFDEAIYWDSVHTNELGARLVAEAIYTDLAPRLASLRGD